MLLSTHYRRPIEFTEEVLTAARKGLATFERLFERITRLGRQPLGDDTPDMDKVAGVLLEGENGYFARAALAHRMKWLEMMDDDFNTAGAIAVMHELAGEVNAFIERHNIEQNRHADLVQAATAAAESLRRLGTTLGLFLVAPPRPQAGRDDALTAKLIELLIGLRQEARAAKQFAIADRVRTGLKDLGISLEDRADGTNWRRD
jgi:cysteinyl-tRNA synthetase